MELAQGEHEFAQVWTWFCAANKRVMPSGCRSITTAAISMPAGASPIVTVMRVGNAETLVRASSLSRTAFNRGLAVLCRRN